MAIRSLSIRFLSLSDSLSFQGLRVISVAQTGQLGKRWGRARARPESQKELIELGGGTCLYHQRRERQEISLCLPTNKQAHTHDSLSLSSSSNAMLPPQNTHYCFLLNLFGRNQKPRDLKEVPFVFSLPQPLLMFSVSPDGP